MRESYKRKKAAGGKLMRWRTSGNLVRLARERSKIHHETMEDSSRESPRSDQVAPHHPGTPGSSTLATPRPESSTPDGAEAKQLPVDHTARLYGLENGEHTVIEPLTPIEPMEARTLRDDDDDIEASRSRVAVQDY